MSILLGNLKQTFFIYPFMEKVIQNLKNSKMRNISSWSFQSFLFEWQFTGSLTN